jgi:hypothetical protein
MIRCKIYFWPTTLVLFSACSLWGQTDAPTALPTFESRAAYAHEIKPHRHTIPTEGVRYEQQLRILLTVSAAGDVLTAQPGSNSDQARFWPKLEAEVKGWKFTPFEKDGKAVEAQVEEYVDLVQPEQLPTRHVPAPALKPNSKVIIELVRTMCFGSCPAYLVTVSTSGIVFEGDHYVKAMGKQTARVDADAVRQLAKQFIDADFYSMDAVYKASVTDNPSYILSITIDGHTKKVEDYVGPSVGMPAIITDLENAVDDFAQTDRWIRGETK